MTILRTLISNRAPPLPRRSMSIPGYGLGRQTLEGQMRAYGEVGVLFAIVSRLAESVSAVEWRLYREGAPDDQPIGSHPALDLWHNPNPFMDQQEFVETSLQHFDLAGETDWYVARSGVLRRRGPPLELWPVRPDWLSPVASATDFIEGWSYQPPGVSTPIPWRVDEVIQMKRPNPLDLYRGLSPVAAAMVDVWGERAAAEYNANFFRNSAEPGGIIQFEDRLEDEEFEEFVERWRQQHQGAENAHRVAVLDGGAAWHERKYTMREMQFDSLRKLNREFIRQAFGYPKSMLGDTEDVNKASAIAGEYVFVRWMVKTRLDRIKSTLNNQLLPRFASADGLEFRYVTPVPADKELEIKELDSQAERAKTLVEAGFDPSAVLRWVGIPDMPFVTPRSAPADGQGERISDENEPGGSLDAAARLVWERAVEMKQRTPSLTWEAIADFMGVSDRTLRRYRQAFGEDRA